ncbi:hypothetical protein C0993_007465, partial [Termitomyces sp. T159_Od127]
DSLAHRRLLVPSSCTPGTRANPRHSSSTLPGTCLTRWRYRHSSTHHSHPTSVSYTSCPSRCSASVYTV